MTTNYFATVQTISFNSYVIFGIGTTKKEAIQDALNWVEEEDGIEGLETIPCSKMTFDYVASEGGDGDFIIDDGILKLASELDEEDKA